MLLAGLGLYIAVPHASVCYHPCSSAAEFAARAVYASEAPIAAHVEAGLDALGWEHPLGRRLSCDTAS